MQQSADDESFLVPRPIDDADMDIPTRIRSSGVDFDSYSSSTSTALLQDWIIDLDLFADIVTTYRCKFCEFNCDRKDALTDHLKSVHRLTVTAVNQGDNNVAAIKAATQLETVNCSPIQDDCKQRTTGQPSMQDNEIFLCGQCKEAFMTLDSCKLHMLQKHQPNDDDDEDNKKSTSMSNKPSPKSSSKLKTKSKHPICKNVNRKTVETQHPKKDIQIQAPSLGKRKVRTPKALAQDYYLPTKRRKYVKRSVGEKRLKCNVSGCNQSYNTEEALDIHVSCHVERALTSSNATADECEFRCPKCNWKDASAIVAWRRMATHVWRSHRMDTELERCPKCPYRCWSVARLEEHKLRHGQRETAGAKKEMKKNESTPDKQQPCSQCGRNFANPKCLRKHTRVVHDKLRPYACDECGYTCARRAMLVLHRRQHTGDKPFACDTCDYRTVDHNTLRRHRMRHSGEKPYKCAHCPYACIQAIALKTHLKKRHPGMAGLFSCNLCSHLSISQSKHSNHMQEHRRLGIDDISSTTTSEPSSAPDDAIHPDNLTAANLIHTCLDVLSQTTTAAVDDLADSQTFIFQIELPPSSTSCSSSRTPGDTSINVTIEPQQNDNNV